RLQATPQALLWTGDGRLLVAVSGHTISVFDREGKPLGSFRLRRRTVVAAPEPGSHRLAVVLAGARSETVTLDLDRLDAAAKQVFAGAGRFSGIAWSPDARWLLLAWRSADQWLFVRMSGGQRIAAVSGISSQFNPGGEG